MEEFLWTEIYRPKTVASTVLPERLKSQFQKFVDDKNIPNLILTGKPGCGKTTIARAMLEELDCDYIIINGSLHGQVDMLRTTIMQFASTISFKGGRKYVILDEADYLSLNTQAALRSFMEEFSRNCGFIFTCNFLHKIITPLVSRASIVTFQFKKEEALEMKKEMVRNLAHLLKSQSVTYDTKVLANLIQKHFPDYRRVISECQAYSVSGTIDTGILQSFSDDAIKEAVGFMKEKNFSALRKWAHENSDINDDEIYTKLYEHSNSIFQPSSIPVLVKILGEAMRQAAFSANREINLVACLVDIMAECEFK